MMYLIFVYHTCTLKKIILLYYNNVIVMVIYVKNILIPRHQVGTSASSLTIDIDNILCVIRYTIVKKMSWQPWLLYFWHNSHNAWYMIIIVVQLGLYSCFHLWIKHNISKRSRACGRVFPQKSNKSNLCLETKQRYTYTINSLNFET